MLGRLPTTYLVHKDPQRTAEVTFFSRWIPATMMMRVRSFLVVMTMLSSFLRVMMVVVIRRV